MTGVFYKKSIVRTIRGQADGKQSRRYRFTKPGHLRIKNSTFAPKKLSKLTKFFCFKFHIIKCIYCTYHAVAELLDHTRQRGCSANLGDNNRRIFRGENCGSAANRLYRIARRLVFRASMAFVTPFDTCFVLVFWN